LPNQWTLLHSRLHQTLKQRQLLPVKARLLVAVSGGQDSLCLLRLLLDLQSRWQWYISAVYCDHRWASDTGIEEHLRGITEAWDVYLYVKTATNPIAATEAAARQWRYQMLTEIAEEEGFKYIFTGHTQSDRAETLLYNSIRGAGSNGLAALTWQRPLTSNISLIRPLLTISRQETGDFCRQLAIPVWEDVCNQDLKYARNRLRQEVIPYLETHFHPQITKNLAQTAEILRSEADYLDGIAHSLLSQLQTDDGKGLNRRELTKLHLCLQRRIIRAFLCLKLAKMPKFEEIEAAIVLIDAPNRSCTSTLTGGYILEVRGESIYLSEI
jgi:tRNA(Ile)-lysidine synthase